MLTDTHCHIYLDEFTTDLAEMLQRAEDESVAKFLMPAIDSETHEKLLAVESAYPGKCMAMMGLHPCSVNAGFRQELKIARKYFEKRKFIAVGETGLDFYWDTSFTGEQYTAFETQIGWALEFDIPIVIHSRNSLDECIKVVGRHQNGKLRGVFHCFSGSAEQARQIRDLGFYLGIGGVVTFKNSGLDKVMAGIEMEGIVLETDAPYLAPVPYRGKRNECSYLKWAVQKLSEIKNISKEEVAAITTKNAKELFRF